jgi:predicted transcriptional regulator
MNVVEFFFVDHSYQTLRSSNRYGHVNSPIKALDSCMSDWWQLIQDYVPVQPGPDENWLALTDGYSWLSLALNDYPAFQKGHILIEEKIERLEKRFGDNDLWASWRAYRQFVAIVADRIIITKPFENFESALEDIDFEDIPAELFVSYLSLIVLVFSREDDPALVKRGSYWFPRIYKQVGAGTLRLSFMALQLAMQLKIAQREELGSFETQLDQWSALAQQDPEFANRPLLGLMAFQLRANWLMARHLVRSRDDDQRVYIRKLLDFSSGYIKDWGAKCDDIPSFVYRLTYFQAMNQWLSVLAAAEQKEILARLQPMMDDIQVGLEILEHRTLTSAYYTEKARALEWMKNPKEANKCLRDALILDKKFEYSRAIALHSIQLAELEFRQQRPAKAVEAVNSGLKYSMKRFSSGGFGIFERLVAYQVDKIVAQVNAPGISWVVKDIEEFFQLLVECHTMMVGLEEEVGKYALDRYMGHYNRLKPATLMNIRVYLRYQFQQVKLLELHAEFHGHTNALQTAQLLIKELTSPLNPLGMIQANWEDFKDVPNDIRNIVLNRCVSIAKGDLPLASEHLDFSYRNLRSYITYKEVNRLGYFLNELETTSKPLETGIRLLFHDLYESGKIFEVVFDMPRFLVAFAQTGFTATDMEQKLAIKYNTAKKYLRIMTENGIIELDRQQGKKNHYTLAIDKAMNRYLQDKEKEARKLAAQAPTT